MTSEKQTRCDVRVQGQECGAARGASCHLRGGGSFAHEFHRAPKPKQRPQYIGRSAQGQVEADQWQYDKAEHLKQFPACELAGFLAGKCEGPLDVHHIQPRSAGGTRHDEGPLVTACRVHHDATENHRTAARALGLLQRRELPAHLRSTVPIGDD